MFRILPQITHQTPFNSDYFSIYYMLYINCYLSVVLIEKYVEKSEAAKMSVEFKGSIIEIPKNRSKFTKNAILDLL